MSHKKITAIFMALICTTIIAIGGCNIHQQKAKTAQSSTMEQSEDISDNSGKPTKDSVKDKDDNTSKSKASTDGNAKNKSVTKSDSTAPADVKNNKTGSSSSSSKSGSSKSSSSTGSTGSASSGTADKPAKGGSSQSKPAETQPVHQHSYTDHSEVTKTATCNASGTQRNYCSCGKYQTVTIPATGNHSWKDQYETRTVPAKTHTENVWKVVCNGCGAQFDNAREAGLHVMASSDDNCQNTSNKIVDTITVVDSPATTEDVFIGRKCSICGTWQ